MSRESLGESFKPSPDDKLVPVESNCRECRVINVWNYLPYDIVGFNSLNAFKRSIERVDF